MLQLKGLLAFTDVISQYSTLLQGVFGPAGGKHLIAFIDDLSMPQKSKFGFIPPLELLKLWVDYGFWYAFAV